MSTLFSRRPGKGSRLGFGSSGSSSKHNKYGAGISNTDLLAASEDVSHPSSYGTTDTRALSPLPLNQQPPSNSPRNGDHQSMPSMYEHAADDFGRMTPTQTKPKSGPSLTLPQLHKPSKSPNNSSHTLTRVSSPQGPMSPSRILSPGPPVARPAPPNAPQGEEAFPYGYTHAEWDIEITQSVAVQVVEICGQEIRARGESRMPSRAELAALLTNFLRTCSRPLLAPHLLVNGSRPVCRRRHCADQVLCRLRPYRPLAIVLRPRSQVCKRP